MLKNMIHGPNMQKKLCRTWVFLSQGDCNINQNAQAEMLSTATKVESQKATIFLKLAMQLSKKSTATIHHGRQLTSLLGNDFTYKFLKTCFAREFFILIFNYRSTTLFHLMFCFSRCVKNTVGLLQWHLLDFDLEKLIGQTRQRINPTLDYKSFSIKIGSWFFTYRNPYKLIHM